MTSYYQTDSLLWHVTGDRAATFLHGQLTNDTTGLAVGSGNYNLLLTNKGRVRADLYVICGEGCFDLIIPKFFIPLVTEHLQKLAPLSRCQIKPDDGKKVWHVLAELDVWRGLGLNHMRSVDLGGAACLVFRTDRLGMFGVDVVTACESDTIVQKFFMEQGASLITDEDVELIRIKNGVPKVGVDVTEENFPQEGRLEHALNFEKGCYLGQEVVARLKYRGHVNKMLCRFVANEADFTSGQEITDSDQNKLGVITSCVLDGHHAHLLGYLSHKTEESGRLSFLSNARQITRKL